MGVPIAFASIGSPSHATSYVPSPPLGMRTTTRERSGFRASYTFSQRRRLVELAPCGRCLALAFVTEREREERARARLGFLARGQLGAGLVVVLGIEQRPLFCEQGVGLLVGARRRASAAQRSSPPAGSIGTSSRSHVLDGDRALGGEDELHFDPGARAVLHSRDMRRGAIGMNQR